MEDHIPERPDRSLLIGRQTSMWSSMKMTLIKVKSHSLYPEPKHILEPKVNMMCLIRVFITS